MVHLQSSGQSFDDADNELRLGIVRSTDYGTAGQRDLDGMVEGSDTRCWQ
jgi:hypothetical protein